ncbi:TPD domain-containing protein [archaeon]|nr:TPD domain-containing protein [archaeon]
MDSAEYYFILERLNSPKDVDVLNEKMGLSRDMLFNILARKVVRKVLKTFHMVKRRQKALFSEWKKGKTICQLAEKFDFPPVLTASFLAEEKGITKKAFQMLLRFPEKATDRRLRIEIPEVLEKDYVYSPKSSDLQRQHGKDAEQKLSEFVSSLGVKFMTEYDIKKTKHHPRTPDFLLKEPVIVDGKKVFWVESKASFGSPEEMRRDYRRQLEPYVKHFGPGIVVYWYGFVEDVVLQNVTIIDENFFSKKHSVKAA